MGVRTGDNKLVIKMEPKTFHLPKDADNNLKHKIDLIIKHNKLLAKHITDNKIR